MVGNGIHRFNEQCTNGKPSACIQCFLAHAYGCLVAVIAGRKVSRIEAIRISGAGKGERKLFVLAVYYGYVYFRLINQLVAFVVK